MIIVMYIIIILNSILSFENSFLVEFFREYEGRYVVYANEYQVDKLESVDIVKNYNGQILATDIENSSTILCGIEKLTSEKIVLCDISIDDISTILDMDILEIVYINDDLMLYNCYTKSLPRKVVCDKGYMNIQVAMTHDIVNIGYPYLVDY